ncbi:MULTISPECIES: DUF1642 domain-containing protein [Lactiplantibacillus]|uniref:DUF1642 domain-containing protein n=1 Tax=Lactiplantibacillus TaxID=2767842 RepID=UPI001C2011C3|nr:MULTISPECIES: DUF1642 domain-containing protein [Lactiplantibacillus]MBU7447080.1 DUF1642 domain-containing protein [Lactiplantibacillus sp. 7.2.4]MBU7480293.1 DUF1642 domain-containing protein [Lactiplantibacillus pentosus]MBU7503789.1 DUF1642 domain-containing protein [Lactiplantibacillus pentosus]MDY1544744.1 DUF1642 domain-containing protein [Lactiplantibacillus pentosus]
MIKIYRKTATIKAEQFDGSYEMVDKYELDKPIYLADGGTFGIETLEGYFDIEVGDWIATGINGETWAIKDDVFKKTYTELPVIPEEVSLSIEDWKKHHRGLDQIFGIVYQHEITRTQGSTTINWIMCGNQDTFARAWIDGYTVEEEK